MGVDIRELTSIKSFKNVEAKTLEQLSNIGTIMKLSKDKALFYERDHVNTIYVVLKGKVTMYRNSEHGQKRIIYILGEGEFINEVIFDDLPASISCEAFEESIILCFSKTLLVELMSLDFKLTKNIIDSMGKKIRRLYRQLKNTVPIKMDKKLAAKLWKLAKDYGVPNENGILIDLNISISYLADMLGSTRETISRNISHFEKDGVICFQGKKIIVRSLEELSIYFRGK